MKTLKIFVISLVFWSELACLANGNEYFDLGYSINNDTIYFPGQKVEFLLNKDIEGYTENGYWYSTYSFCMGEHGGTHVDAPIHFDKGGWTLDEIPSSHLIDVKAVIVDVEKKVFSNEHPDKYTLQVEDLIEHESINGQIPSGAVVLLHTSWARYWPDKVKYLGWKNVTSGAGEKGKSFLSFPGCSEAAAKWLINERKIVGFGIDTPSVDVGESKDNFPVHSLFAKHQIYNIENLANMHLVLRRKQQLETVSGAGVRPSEQLRLFVLPIKITGGTGGPARILAYWKSY